MVSLSKKFERFGKRRFPRAYEATRRFWRRIRHPAAPSNRQGQFAEAVAEVERLAGSQAYIEALNFAAVASETLPLAAQRRLLGHFAQYVVALRASAHGRAASHVDAILSGSAEQLAKALGDGPYQRMVAGMAEVLARVGRYDEAIALLAPELERRPKNVRLLRARAEIVWPHDRELAQRDLAALVASGKASEGDALLDAYLRIGNPGAAVDGPMPVIRSNQAGLIAAMEAHAAGDCGGQVAALNRFFEGQGLAPVFADGVERFSFDRMGVATTPAEDGPLVSVIMTSFNAEATIRYAVQSILAQTYRDVELLIADDASTDGTLALLDELAAGDARIQVIRSAVNAGTYVAKNRAMELSRGAFLTFHDSDDWAHPQRLERHVQAMLAHPGAIMSRSNWVRVSPGGEIEMCRWGRRIAHPNPASSFLRRELVERIGYFDPVRVSADTEYRLRARMVFGKDAILSLPLTLGLGALHEASLTQSGAGAMSIDKYSEPRSQYAASYWDWYFATPPEQLYISADPKARRAFAAPAAILPNPADAVWLNPLQRHGGARADEVAPVVLGISLASQAASSNWERTSELLAHTLRSVLGQSDPNFSVVVCGHERPDIAELEDERISFLVADAPPPAERSKFRNDKMRKRRLIGQRLRELGGGYFVPLDADDLVHRDLVAHVRATNNRAGYVVRKGYALDFANRLLAPVPGVWSADLNRICGSSAVLYFEKDELPVGGDNEEDLYFNLFQSHAYWPVVAEEYGRPLADLPFPGAVYVLNHSQNLSFGLQREGARTANILRKVAEQALHDGAGILQRDFAFAFATTDRDEPVVPPIAAARSAPALAAAPSSAGPARP